jgi:hypothetical protein
MIPNPHLLKQSTTVVSRSRLIEDGRTESRCLEDHTQLTKQLDQLVQASWQLSEPNAGVETSRTKRRRLNNDENGISDERLVSVLYMYILLP